MRLLELATPFADFDQTEPLGSSAENPWDRVEVGLPRVKTQPTGSRLDLELGTLVQNESLSVVVLARPTRSEQ